MQASLSPEVLIATFLADPNTLFSEEEVRSLELASISNIWAAKAAALHSFRAGNFQRSLPLFMSILKREPTGENVRNAVVCLRSLRDYSEALALLEGNKNLMEAIRYEDMLCSLYGLLGRREEAIRHGDEALRLKDASSAAIALKAARIHRFDPERRSRNVICFSLWGSNPRYLEGALTNAIVARYLYPGWTPRFYVDGSVPEDIRDALKHEGAEIVLVSDLPAARYGLFWRFLAEDDPKVDLYLVRDADSVSNIKERWAVADWLEEKTAFHVMRDDLQHSEVMLAGMWGAHRGNLKGMRKRFVDFLNKSVSAANDVTADQRFLRTCIWPVARNSVTMHDSCFNFRQPKRFSPAFQLPSDIHIGQNDHVNSLRPSLQEAQAGDGSNEA